MDQALGINTTPITIGGKDYDLSPLSLGMLGEFARYFKTKPLRDFNAQAKELGLPKELYSEMVKDLYRQQAADKRTTEQILNEYSESEEGLLYFLYLRLEQSGVTLKDVARFPIPQVMASMEQILDTGVDVPEEAQKKILERLGKYSSPAGAPESLEPTSTTSA